MRAALLLLALVAPARADYLCTYGSGPLRTTVYCTGDAVRPAPPPVLRPDTGPARRPLLGDRIFEGSPFDTGDGRDG